MKTELNDWTTILYSGVLLLSSVLCILLLSSFESHSETTTYVAIQGGASSWTQTSNRDEMEASTEPREQFGIAFGKRFTFDRVNMRVELEAAYTPKNIHGKNGGECERQAHAQTFEIPRPVPNCKADATLNVATFFLNYWPGYALTDRLSLYAGGGTGVILFSALNQQTTAWGAQAGGGLELRLFDYDETRWVLDAGYRALWALETRQLNGNQLEYTSHGPVLRLGVEF